MIKKIIVILITTFTLVINAHAASDGELILKKMNHLKLKIAPKLSIKRLLLLIRG